MELAVIADHLRSGNIFADLEQAQDKTDRALVELQREIGKQVIAEREIEEREQAK